MAVQTGSARFRFTSLDLKKTGRDTIVVLLSALLLGVEQTLAQADDGQGLSMSGQLTLLLVQVVALRALTRFGARGNNRATVNLDDPSAVQKLAEVQRDYLASQSTPPKD